MAEFSTIARPYAKSAYDVAVKNSKIDEWQNALFALSFLVEQPKMAEYIGQVGLDSAQKADKLLDLLGEFNLSKDVLFRNFVHIVVSEKRFFALPEIYKQFHDFVLKQYNTQEATILTAYDIVSEGQRAKIISDLEQRFKVRLHAVFKTDPSLIGGIKVVMGDQVLDLSVQGKLQKLYTAMTN